MLGLAALPGVAEAKLVEREARAVTVTPVGLLVEAVRQVA